MSNHELNREARCKVEAELLNRGASVESKSLGPLKVRLFATDAARRRTVELGRLVAALEKEGQLARDNR